MKRLLLGSKKYPGLLSIVDDEDYQWLNVYGWCPSHEGSKVYAAATIDYQHIRMHRFIMQKYILLIPEILVDHKDGDGLNNQKSNLRICTQTENLRNCGQFSHKNMHTTSKYKGVYWKKDKQKWEATVKVNYKKYFLGYFNDEETAALSYNNAAVKHFGQFANINIL